jgi:hypothetical protein
MFRPIGLEKSDCEVLAEHQRLRIPGAPLRYVFVMKLCAGRTRYHTDLQALWARCDFASPQEAASLFHEAYPHLEHDPFLADYIAEIAAAAD